ncbi:MAG: flagellar biosynthesis protein FlhF [Campylobacterota bacterium]|nr:flagellar biosynthesis protein FlhF [Campylobacterota bacterium]
MIHETFVALDPKSAYAQAVTKYGHNLSIISAKQLAYDDGVVRCEVVIAIPRTLYLEKSTEIEVVPESKSSEEVRLLDELSVLKSQLKEMKDELVHDIQEEDTVISKVKKLFIKTGIDEKWLEKIFTSLHGTEMLEDASLLVAYILEEIDETLRVKEESFIKKKIMMLVGPTGVGKTTTIAKLAARYAYLLEKPYKVVLFNLDSYKIGAIEQLENYADIMQIEHHAILSVDDFKEKLQQVGAYDVVLVDTAGMSPYDTQKFIRTVEFMNINTKIEIEVNLVLSATVKYEDMEDIYKNFSFLNLNSLIISKFDETKHFGTLLNFMLKYGVPMSYFSIGQEVPDDLMLAKKEYLLEQFIGDVHEG